MKQEHTMSDARSTALIVIDLQNDFLAPGGAYDRGGAVSAEARALPPRWRRWRAPEAAGGFVAASQFTLWPAAGEPMISPHLRRLRPFLRRGDFAAGGGPYLRGRAGRPGRRGRLEGCLFGLLQYAAGLGAAARRHRARGHLRHRDQRRRGQHGARRAHAGLPRHRAGRRLRRADAGVARRALADLRSVADLRACEDFIAGIVR